MDLTIGLAIPFLGTTLGAAMVFFMKNKLSLKVEKLLLGFASGVMIAASFWSLIAPALELSEELRIHSMGATNYRFYSRWTICTII